MDAIATAIVFSVLIICVTGYNCFLKYLRYKGGRNV